MKCEGCNASLLETDVVIEVCRDKVFCGYCAIPMSVHSKMVIDLPEFAMMEG